MTKDEFISAIVFLEDEGLRVPYGQFPGTDADGTVHDIWSTDAKWRGYVWGGPDDDTGPQYLISVAHLESPDANASPKPSRAALRAAVTDRRRHEAKEKAENGVRQEEIRHICRAYLHDQSVPYTVESEQFYRLRALEAGLSLTEKHAERDRLHRRAVALQTWIEDSARTIEELEAFDSAEEVHWAKPSPGGEASNPQSLGDADVTTTNALVYSPTGVVIPTGIVEGGGTAYLRALEFRGEFVTIKLSATDSGDGDDVGPEFTEAWKQNGTFTVTSGTESVTVPGPQASSNLLSDSSEPYHYTLGSRVAQEAFITAVHAATDRSSTVVFST